MNTHEELRAMLDDFAGGELDEAGRRAVLRHLDGCAECRAEVAAIRALLDEARFLPREVAPSRDLWASIAPRLEPRAVLFDSGDIAGSAASMDSIASSGSAGSIASADGAAKVISLESRRRVWKAPKWLLAAAATIVVAVGSSLTTMAVMNGRGTGPVADGALPPTTVTPTSRPGTALAAFQPAEVQYQAAIDDLTQLLESQRDRMLPETAATLEENLRIIDEAIRQSRAALERDPNSAELTQMLSSVYEAKVRTLQQAVSL